VKKTREGDVAKKIFDTLFSGPSKKKAKESTTESLKIGWGGATETPRDVGGEKQKGSPTVTAKIGRKKQCQTYPEEVRTIRVITSGWLGMKGGKGKTRM